MVHHAQNTCSDLKTFGLLLKYLFYLSKSNYFKIILSKNSFMTRNHLVLMCDLFQARIINKIIFVSKRKYEGKCFFLRKLSYFLQKKFWKFEAAGMERSNFFSYPKIFTKKSVWEKHRKVVVSIVFTTLHLFFPRWLLHCYIFSNLDLNFKRFPCRVEYLQVKCFLASTKE